MNYYPVLESELDHISSLTKISNLSLSTAGAATGVAMTLWLAKVTIPLSVFSTDTTMVGQVLMNYGPLSFGVLALALGAIGALFLHDRNSIIAKIKGSSKIATIRTAT